jgi:hypothetical protein
MPLTTTGLPPSSRTAARSKERHKTYLTPLFHSHNNQYIYRQTELVHNAAATYNVRTHGLSLASDVQLADQSLSRVLRAVNGRTGNITGFDMRKLKESIEKPQYDPWER